MEPDLPAVAAHLTPDDPDVGGFYNLHRIRAFEGWDVAVGDADARVCVLDTGVRYTHEDLAGARWLGGRDFVNGDLDPWDDQGHGTHVAGIAAATMANGLGVAGVGQVGILAGKVLDASGSGTFADVAEGIAWCADQGERIVVSMSLGSSSTSLAMEDAVAYAASKGALLVASAGNAGCDGCVRYPAAYPEVVAVGCTSEAGLCSYSSRGPQVELVAPGDKILSTAYASDASTTRKSGTSMSAPHVSGAAALVWSVHTHLAAADVRARLVGTAEDLHEAGRDDATGHGELDLHCLLRNLTPCRPPGPPPQPAVHVRPLDGAPWTAGTLRVVWDFPADTAGHAPTAFRVHRTTLVGASGFVAEVPGTAVSYDDPACPVGDRCAYRVSAVTAVGEGPLSPPGSGPGLAFVAGVEALAARVEGTLP